MNDAKIYKNFSNFYSLKFSPLTLVFFITLLFFALSNFHVSGAYTLSISDRHIIMNVNKEFNDYFVCFQQPNSCGSVVDYHNSPASRNASTPSASATGASILNSNGFAGSVAHGAYPQAIAVVQQPSPANLLSDQQQTSQQLRQVLIIFFFIQIYNSIEQNYFSIFLTIFLICEFGLLFLIDFPNRGGSKIDLVGLCHYSLERFILSHN